MWYDTCRMKIFERMSSMKRRFIVARLAVVAMSATLRASVTLTSLTGSPNVRGTATFAVAFVVR